MRPETASQLGDRGLIATAGSARGDLQFRRLLEKLPVGAYTCDPDGLITYYNPQALQLWGRAPKINDPEDRFCGSFRLFTAEGVPLRHDQCWMALALRDERGYNGAEIVIERPAGQRLSALAYANPIHDEATGRLLGAVNVLVDVSDLQAAQRALLASEVKFARAFGLAPLAIAISSRRTGRFIEVNDTFVELTGFSRDEAVGSSASELGIWVDPDEAVAGVAELERGGSVREREVRLRFRDGEVRHCLISAEIIDIEGEPCVVNATVDITARKRAEESLAELNRTLETQIARRTQQVRQLAGRLVLAETNERGRMAQVLHDDLQQQLYAAQFAMYDLRRQLGGDHPAIGILDEVGTVLKDAVVTARHIVADLSPPVLRGEGLDQGLSWLCSHFEERFGLQVEIEIAEAFAVPREAVRVLLLNLVRELLFNVVKHAGTNEAAVAVTRAGETIEIHVTDRGAGFDPDALDREGHGTGLGLSGIRQRLELFDGELRVETRPGAGTRVVIALPASSFG